MAITITKPDVGASEDSWGDLINTALDAIVLEINSNADGTNAITPNLTEGSWEISTTPVTASAADLNAIDGFDATGVTMTEVGYLSGASSNIQNQIDTINAASGSGTVTSVGLNMPTGFSVSGSPVTTFGTLSVTMASGYAIPTSTQVSNIPSSSDTSNWNTAYGWGDHSTQGYLTSTSTLNSDKVGTAYATYCDDADKVGTYGFCFEAADSAVHYTYPGDNMGSVSMYFSDTAGSTNSSLARTSGTWRCMGYSSTKDRRTLFVRIS
jgi:hypothetical protein